MDLQGITNSQLINFADDTNMITANKCPLKLIETANNDLKKISTYMSANSLLINPKKTQAILLKPKNKPAIDIQNQLTLDDQPIEIVKNARYLGATFDSQLNFKAQSGFTGTGVCPPVFGIRATLGTLVDLANNPIPYSIIDGIAYLSS